MGQRTKVNRLADQDLEGESNGQKSKNRCENYRRDSTPVYIIGRVIVGRLVESRGPKTIEQKGVFT